jgi:8-oxo-dGTP pyrophosphatase MutT (NUDIX family)
VDRIRPHDDQEAADQEDIRSWIASGEPLYRVQPPATPPRHLAVYFALLDEADRSVMLVDHVKAGCWLLPGGHVDEGEDPRRTAAREAHEELGITAVFHDRFGGEDGFFLSQTQTRGAYSHTDVTLWFVFAADRRMTITPDPGEFRGIGWFGLEEPIQWDAPTFDPQMHRFVAKLNRAMATVDLTTAPQPSVR